MSDQPDLGYYWTQWSPLRRLWYRLRYWFWLPVPPTQYDPGKMAYELQKRSKQLKREMEELLYRNSAIAAAAEMSDANEACCNAETPESREAALKWLTEAVERSKGLQGEWKITLKSDHAPEQGA